MNFLTKMGETKKESSEYENKAPDLEEIYAYLELDTVTDSRLRLKANLMKKVIFYTAQWKEGFGSDWIDKLANRSSVSTRKIKEDYLQPLITEGILEFSGRGYIKFIGLPKNAEKVLELSEKQLMEELEEENEKRAELGQKKLTLEDWKKMRSRRFKPLD